MEDFSLQEEAGSAFWRDHSLKPEQHGISERQWLEYLDGTLGSAEQGRVRAHVEQCAGCAKLAAELMVWRDSLLAAGERLREASRLPDEALDLMLSRSIERLRSAEPDGIRSNFAWTVAEGITVLRFLMEPICGPGTARAAIDLAVRRSADDRSRLNTRNWRLFVGNLSDATALICGLAAGRLVDRAGLCLAIEEG